MMTTVFFSKNGVGLAESFASDSIAHRWARLVERNGFRVDGLLEH